MAANIDFQQSFSLDIAKEKLLSCPVDSWKNFLRSAICHERLDIVKFAIEENAYDIDLNGGALLHAAACFGHTEIVKYLVDKGCSPSKMPFPGLASVTFHSGTSFTKGSGGKLEIIKFLVENGADPSEHRSMCLEGPSIFNRVDVLEYLVNNGADPCANHSGFYKAAEEGCYEAVKYFVSVGTPITKYDLASSTKTRYYRQETTEYLFWVSTRSAKIYCLDCDPYGDYDELIPEIVEAYNLHMILRETSLKHKFLVRILRPTSMHMQLMSIE
jgi:hypothetical protein